MANLIRREILNEGTRWVWVHWYFESDGNEGELNDYVLLDPAVDFKVPVAPQISDAGQLLPPELTVRRMWGATAWFDVIFGFQGQAANDYRFIFARDAEFDIDFTPFSGIKDKSPPENLPTGALICKTRDFAPAGSSGFIIMEIRKD